MHGKMTYSHAPNYTKVGKYAIHRACAFPERAPCSPEKTAKPPNRKGATSTPEEIQAARQARDGNFCVPELMCKVCIYSNSKQPQ